MAVFKEVYAESNSAGIIANGASETFGGSITNMENRDKYGSANSLVITSFATEQFRIDLDGLTTRTIGILQPNGSFIIKPEDGIFFNTVKLTNVSSTSSTADEVKVRLARGVRVAA